MRILVLHQHYWPEIAATAQLLSDLCEDLATRGHEVIVVCGQPSYRVHGADRRMPSADMHRGVQIRRVPCYAPKHRGIPQRLAHYGSYFLNSFLSSLVQSRPHVCLVMSTPPLLLGASGALLKHMRSVPFVYSVQDLYPDIAVHLGVISADGLATRAIDRAATFCYRAASAVVTLSDGMASRLASRGVARNAIHVIPNWADTSTIQPEPRNNPFAREHGLSEGFVVQYAGNLGQSQGLEHLIDAADLLKGLPIKFALVGDGNARASLERAARAKGLSNVHFLPPQPRERLSQLLGACDVGLVSMKRGVGEDLVPSKLYGIMAAARPVLAAAELQSEVARVVSKHRCGWTVAPESPTSLAEGIRTAFEAHASDRSKRGHNGRVACDEQYSRHVLTERYAHVLERSASVRSTASQRRPAATVLLAQAQGGRAPASVLEDG